MDSRTSAVSWNDFEDLEKSTGLDEIWRIAAFIIDDGYNHRIACEVVRTYTARALAPFFHDNRRQDEVLRELQNLAQITTSFGEVFALGLIAYAGKVTWADIKQAVNTSNLRSDALMFLNYRWGVELVTTYAEVQIKVPLEDYIAAINYIAAFEPLKHYKEVIYLADFLLRNAVTEEEVVEISSALQKLTKQLLMSNWYNSQLYGLCRTILRHQVRDVVIANALLDILRAIENPEISKELFQYLEEKSTFPGWEKWISTNYPG